MEESLINALRERAANKSLATDMTNVIPATVFPVARPDQIARAEHDLGFPLPPLLKELYLRVGNGGYGPGYGLIGTTGGAKDDLGKNLESLYADFIQAVEQGRPPLIGTQDGRRALELVLGVYESARTGRPVALGGEA